MVALMKKRERLWERYWSIRDAHGNGHRMPVLRHLALRRDPMAMTELGSELVRAGRPSERFSQVGLYHRAYRSGYGMAAQHLAMNAFNRGDLTNYRRWLARAARAGDVNAGNELRRFETRLPHRNAGLIGRRRPFRRSDFE
jgi:hypothetical protein